MARVCRCRTIGFRGVRRRGGIARSQACSFPSRTTARRRPRFRRRWCATQTAARPCAPSASMRRCASTASWTRRCITNRHADRRLHPGRAEPWHTRDRKDRGLDFVRHRQRIHLSSRDREPAGPDGAERDAPRQQQHLAEREFRVRLRHLLRPAQQRDFQFTPIGGRADGQNTNEGQYNGDWNPIWTFKVRRERRVAGPVKRRFPSSRCATGRAARRSGASSCAASTDGRTRTRT